MILWLGFIVCTAAIVYSGTKLSKYGDVIAEKTGLGGTWIGIVLMASVTSLPELITGVSSVTYADVPNIAVGDVLGSCVFNMLILAVLDALCKPEPLSTKAHHGNILSAGFGILLLTIVALSISFANYISPIGWIGAYTFLIVTGYLIAMRLVHFYEKRQMAAFVKGIAKELRYESVRTKEAVSHYAVNAVIVIIAAVFLPKIGEGIAAATGLGQTFVGNILIAISTSLPEVAVSVAAVKMSSFDLAIGNLFGSNIFNIFILAIDDILFVRGPILSFTNPHHEVSALSAIAMATVAVIGLTYRAGKKRLFLAWDSIGIIAVYMTNIALLYLLK